MGESGVIYDFKGIELSCDSMASFLTNFKLIEASSQFLDDSSINLDVNSNVIDKLEGAINFFELYKICLNEIKEEDLIKGMINLASKPQVKDFDSLEFSYIDEFSNCMWTSVSNMFGDPLSMHKVDISNNINHIKLAFDIFTPLVVHESLYHYMDFWFKCNLCVTGIDDDYIDESYITDSVYEDISPGYRDSFIVDKALSEESYISNEKLNNMSLDMIKEISNILLNDLYKTFRLDLVFVSYDGLNELIDSQLLQSDSLNSVLADLAELCKYSCPQFINITVPTVLSCDNEFSKLNPFYINGNVVAFLAFSDNYNSFEHYDSKLSSNDKKNEMYKIWSAYKKIDNLISSKGK